MIFQAFALWGGGRSWRIFADVQKSQQDSFPTPFTRFNARQMPGVEIHANLLDNLINPST